METRPAIRNRYLIPIKYGIVGLFVTALDIVVLYTLVEYENTPLLTAATISFFISLSVSFTLQKNWTFHNKNRRLARLYAKFAIVALSGLCINNALLWIFAHIFGIWYIAAKILTSGFVAVWNFISNKLWTFADISIPKNTIEKPQNGNIDFSVIIPAYNEEMTLRTVVTAVHAYLKKNFQNFEIIVVDDGSKDETERIGRNLPAEFPEVSYLRQPENRGKGAAVQRGILRANGKIILFMDADASTEIQEWERLAPAFREGHEVVIGSRYLAESTIAIRQPPLRVMIGRIGNVLTRFTLIEDVMDTQCGFKAFTYEASRHIFPRQKTMRWAFDMEILAIAKHLGYPIKEVAVTWQDATLRKSNIRAARDAMRTLRDLLRIKLNLWAKRYHDAKPMQEI